MASNLGFTVPWWVKVALRLAAYIPLGPVWTAIDSALLLIVDNLPQLQQAQAKAALSNASAQAPQTGSPELHKKWIQTYCSGTPGCPPDTKQP